MTGGAATSFAGLPSLRDWRPIVLIPRLTAFLAIATSARSTGRLLFGLGVVVVVFGFARAARSGWFWIGVAVVACGWNLLDWATIDNHIVLAGYWYLALGISLLSDDPERQMSIQARVLVGLVFTVAVIRKVVNPEYVNGDFFVFTLLVDPRFEPAASAIGGVADPTVNQIALGSLPNPIVLTTASGIRPLAVALTWGAVIAESIVAVFHLLPAATWRRAGQISLVVFIVVTYLLVPVVAFGAGLIVMGAASAASERARIAWSIGFFALGVWGFIWQGATL
jgi:hypothetical protein